MFFFPFISFQFSYNSKIGEFKLFKNIFVVIYFQAGQVSGLILVRPPTAWEERLQRRPQLIQAARYNLVA